MQTIKLDGVEYDCAHLSEKHKAIVLQLRELEIGLDEKKGILLALNRAKNSHIAELKNEILGSKAGFDFGEL